MITGTIIVGSILAIGLIIGVYKIAVDNTKPKPEIDISSLTSDEDKILMSAYKYAEENKLKYDANLVIFTIRETKNASTT